MSTKFRQVVHLYLKQQDEHRYYGSIPALYQYHSDEELGIKLQSLYNVFKNEPYENDKIILKKGRLLTTKKKVRDS